MSILNKYSSMPSNGSRGIKINAPRNAGRGVYAASAQTKIAGLKFTSTAIEQLS
ncbi:MAG: hypothetical protein AB1705_11405 [Verrucomicrobiota bacterium]